MNVLFKCDQSAYIGSGHINRCNALAEIFRKKKNKCFFLGLKPGIAKKNKISNHNQIKDYNFTINYIKKNKIDVIIKDIYSLEYEWEKKISKKVFLLVIDDFNNKKHFCHLYLNYQINFNKKIILKQINKECKLLIGPIYTIVKKIKKIKKLKFKNKTIFIYMGDSDKFMYMNKFVNIFKNKLFNEFSKIFLLNKNHLRKKKMINTLKKIKNCKVFKHKLINFHQYLKSSDLCITPAGQTMIEQIFLKTNCLIVAQNTNQKKIAKALEKKKIISFVSDLKSLNYEYINKSLKKFKLKNNIINHRGKFLIYKEVLSGFKTHYNNYKNYT